MANHGVKGVTFYITATSGSSTLTQISQVDSINAPGAKMGTRDVTHLGSTVKECESTIGDPQEYDVSFIYDPNDAGQVAFRARATNSPSTVLGGDTFKIVHASTTRFHLHQGIVMQADLVGGTEEGTWMLMGKVKPSRAVTEPTTV